VDRLRRIIHQDGTNFSRRFSVSCTAAWLDAVKLYHKRIFIEELMAISSPRTRTSFINSAYFYILPALLVLGFTSLYPVIYSIIMSFFNWDWGLRFEFVGVQNYIHYFTDPVFWQVLWQTFTFTVGAVAVEFALGMALAVIINRLSVGMGMIRTILMTPLMVSGIIVSLIWKILLDPTLGIVNYFIKLLGLPSSSWFGATSTAMPSIILVDTWWQTAFVFIVLSAGLRSLPSEPFEAAEVDGATSLQSFRYLTIPMMKPTILTVLIFRTIDCLKVFAIIFGTTGGGPNMVTESIQTLAYRTAFKYLYLSRSMTLMVIFSVVILAFCLIYMRVGERGKV
jgi:multiple sugar transport system permease protein